MTKPRPWRVAYSAALLLGFVGCTTTHVGEVPGAAFPGDEMAAGMVANPYRSDEQIRADILTNLTMDASLDVFELRVGVSDGIVRLSGTAGSEWEAERVESLVRRVQGVRDVDNEILVRRPADFGAAG